MRQAEISTSSRDDALDILQDSMIKLAAKYADQTENWPQLFQRILQNTLRDWHRRKKVRNWLSFHFGEEEPPVTEEQNHEPISNTRTPENIAVGDQKLKEIERALQQLPQRQQQAFLLRAWWGASTDETAFAMACSTGSVKTHYSRALSKLQVLLEDLK